MHIRLACSRISELQKFPSSFIIVVIISTFFLVFFLCFLLAFLNTISFSDFLNIGSCFSLETPFLLCSCVPLQDTLHMPYPWFCQNNCYPDWYSWWKKFMTISSSKLHSCFLSYLARMHSTVILDRLVCLSSNGVHILPDFKIFEHNLVHHKRTNYANHDLSLLSLRHEFVSFDRFW